ncbi:MAG: hypothetical protein WD491_09115 [Balneolales bacterium]
MKIENLYHVLTMVENMFKAKNGSGGDVDMQKQMLEMKGQAADIIKRYPVGSLAAAVAAGFVIGKILNR